MSLKTMGLSIVIGSVFSGAKALANSNYALKKLDLSISKLNQKKQTYKQIPKNIKRLNDK